MCAYERAVLLLGGNSLRVLERSCQIQITQDMVCEDHRLTSDNNGQIWLRQLVPLKRIRRSNC